MVMVLLKPHCTCCIWLAMFNGRWMTSWSRQPVGGLGIVPCVWFGPARMARQCFNSVCLILWMKMRIRNKHMWKVRMSDRAAYHLPVKKKKKGREARRYCISCVKFFVDGRSLSFSWCIHFLLCLLVTRTCSMIVFVAWRSVNGGNLFRRAIVVLCCYISALSARK